MTSRSARTRTSIGVAVGLLLALASPLRAATSEDGRGGKSGKEGKPKEIGFYATSVGRSDSDLVVVEYWSKGHRFRAQTIVSGHPIITVVRGDEYYTWDDLTGEGYVVERTPAAIAADQKRERPFGLELQELLDAGGEKIRSETLNGVRVDVYRVTDDEGRRTLWVDAERLKLPIRLETYDRVSGRTGQLDWVTWLPGLVIPDGFFEPRQGLALQRFDSYGAYLEKLREAPIPPAPPLFHYLLHEAGGSDD